jgi:hypothetical protein
MKAITLFLITGLSLLVPSLQAGERGGGVGFAVPAPRAPSSGSRVTSAPIVRPALAPRSAPNFRRGYSPMVQGPRTLPYTRTYTPQSTRAFRQRDPGRLTTTQNVQNRSARTNDLQAVQRNRHESHDRDWWRQHFPRIVLFGGGYYYWDSGYWYPCWGYDPTYSYDNDGPIYAYGNLLPDQVISNVQIELQQEGYYAGPVNGSLDAPTRAAVANYQREHGLAISGSVDETTVESLGLG